MPAATIVTVPVADLVFERKYYPRKESQSPQKVQEYALSIAEGGFPPILVTQENQILDGWHRWKAAGQAQVEALEAVVLDITGMDDYTIRRKAARANVRHGLPQTVGELQQLIREEYRAKVDQLDQPGREALKKEMQQDYGRSEAYIREVTSKIDKDLKAELRETAFQMWLACYTQDDIAEAVGYSRAAIVEFSEALYNVRNASAGVSDTSAVPTELLLGDVQEFEDEEPDDDEIGNRLGVYHLEKRALLRAHHFDDQYKPPLYNIWRQQERSAGVSHFGNSEITWVDHLLYLYTKPFDIVIDPFAGSGSTIDLCKTRLRRYLVSDRKPIDIRDDIRCHDVTEGVLAPPNWKQVALVYLDPPYWKQAEGRYSADPSDLGNMDLDTFHQTLMTLILGYAEKLRRARAQAHIACIIQPTQWNAPDHRYTDHIMALLREMRDARGKQLPLAMRFSCPYGTEQYTPQMVEWAKANKECLVLTREMLVWKIAP